MPYISWISPQSFIETVAKLDTINLEAIAVFPMEYYVFGEGITLYKQVMSKIYATKITIGHTILPDSISEVSMVLFKGKTIKLDDMIDDLKTNHQAKQLLKPLEMGDNFTLQVSRL